MRTIRTRQSGLPLDVAAIREIAPIPHEVLLDITAITKRVHDVRVLGRMPEPERMPKFMQAGQIHDCFSKQWVSRCATGDHRSECLSIRAYKYNRAAPAVDRNREHFSNDAAAAEVVCEQILTAARRHKANSHECVLFGFNDVKTKTTVQRS